MLSSYIIIVFVRAFLPALCGAFKVLCQQFVENAQHLSHHLFGKAASAEEFYALWKYTMESRLCLQQ